MFRPLVAAVVLSVVAAGVTAHADWLRFRGPNGTGVSQDKQSPPVSWSGTENLKWKVKLPGPGHSCPIIVGDKIFVTCWSGYGDGGDGSQEDLKRRLVCLERETGNTVWDKSVKAALPEDRYGGMFAEHGYASHTPVSDGENVYVFFGKSGVVAFDMEGKQLWQTKVGSGRDRRGWGSSCSPVLYKDLVIVCASAEDQALVALNKKTGEEVWKQKADGFASTWGTPVLVKVDEERTDLVLGVPWEIWGFTPETGKLKWYCEAMETDSYCSSVVADGDTVYGIEGRSGGSIAVKVGGEKDITDSNVVWSGRDSSRIGTPIVVDGRIYFFNNGVANCINAKTGDRVYQNRLTGGSSSGRGGGRRSFGGDYASPVAADGKIYFVSRGGNMYVLKAGEEFEQLAVNRVTDDNEDFSATPAIDRGALYIRSSKHLYCIAEQKESKATTSEAAASR